MCQTEAKYERTVEVSKDFKNIFSPQLGKTPQKKKGKNSKGKISFRFCCFHGGTDLGKKDEQTKTFSFSLIAELFHVDQKKKKFAF